MNSPALFRWLAAAHAVVIVLSISSSTYFPGFGIIGIVWSLACAEYNAASDYRPAKPTPLPRFYWRLQAAWRLLRGKPAIANTQLHLCDNCHDMNMEAWNGGAIVGVQIHRWSRDPFQQLGGFL